MSSLPCPCWENPLDVPGSYQVLPLAMPAAAQVLEGRAFRARIRHQRHARLLPRRMYFLTTPQLLTARATDVLLARAANRMRDRYERLAYGFPATDAFPRR